MDAPHWRGMNMAGQQTTMERLFYLLDEEAKTLDNENDRSFIRNLGLAMERVYTDGRGLLGRSTLQDQHKTFRSTYLSLMQEEKIQANHQVTSDSIGLILGFLVKRSMSSQEKLYVINTANDTGHLGATVEEVLSEIVIMHHLIEVDPVLSHVSVHLANFLEIPFNVYP